MNMRVKIENFHNSYTKSSSEKSKKSHITKLVADIITDLNKSAFEGMEIDGEFEPDAHVKFIGDLGLMQSAAIALSKEAAESYNEAVREMTGVPAYFDTETGNLYINYELIEQQLTESNNSPDTSRGLSIVIAHEVAHLWQYQSNMPDLDQNKATCSSFDLAEAHATFIQDVFSERNKLQWNNEKGKEQLSSADYWEKAGLEPTLAEKRANDVRKDYIIGSRVLDYLAETQFKNKESDKNKSKALALNLGIWGVETEQVGKAANAAFQECENELKHVLDANDAGAVASRILQKDVVDRVNSLNINTKDLTETSAKTLEVATSLVDTSENVQVKDKTAATITDQFSDIQRKKVETILGSEYIETFVRQDSALNTQCNEQTDMGSILRTISSLSNIDDAVDKSTANETRVAGLVSDVMDANIDSTHTSEETGAVKEANNTLSNNSELKPESDTIVSTDDIDKLITEQVIEINNNQNTSVTTNGVEQDAQGADTDITTDERETDINSGREEFNDGVTDGAVTQTTEASVIE